ncbi:MAG: TIGR02302 family protein [Bauldia sp.]|nr:TIGR02302 family protein [Bauldia sp.]
MSFEPQSRPTPAAPLDRLVRQDEAAVRARVSRAVRRARWVLLWESLWPRLVPLLLVAALFLAVSWFGLWAVMAGWVRIAVLAAFGLGAVAALVPLAGLRWPKRAAALARVERVTGSLHHGATAALDRMAPANDATTRALWQIHRQRLLAGIGRVRSGTPAPGVARRDPFAIRYLVILILAVAFVYAGPVLPERVADAFRGLAPASAREAAAMARIDAWATPPGYTGRPPIFLTGDAVRASTGPIAVPEGTQLVVRIGAGRGDVVVRRDGEEVPLAASAGDGPAEYTIPLGETATIDIEAGGVAAYSWTFDVIPDEPPVIALVGEPSRSAGGSLQLRYTVTDDYGVVSATAALSLGARDAEAEPLYDLSPIALTLSPAGSADGAAATTADLTEHPFAGAAVRMDVSATDAAGQTGTTNPRAFTLPERNFSEPLARALIEQRRNLALDAREAVDVATALDLLTYAPQYFGPGTGAFLSIRTAYYALLHARSEDELRAVVDLLWEVAIGIENGALADEAARLAAAADALREAIERGASEEEIAALMDALRDAMAQYMQALAQQARERDQAIDRNAEQMQISELDDMLNELESLAQQGQRQAANDLLDQLEEMMQNLEAATVDQLQQRQQGGVEAIERLGDMLQRQQRLMDETFALQQQQNQPWPQPNSDEEARQLLDDLAARRQEQAARAGELQQQQQQLQQDLQQLQEEFDGAGMEPIPQLGEAGEAMDRAAGELGEGVASEALSPQSDALNALREGAQAMIEQLGQQSAEGGGQDSGQQRGAGQDPLGRPLQEGGARGGGVDVPEEIDRQRAREILETIRERLEEMNRPQLERDYLERLLDAF